MTPPQIAGVVWYKREDYEAARAVMSDAQRLPATYSQWRTLAEQAEKQARRAGWATSRVYLDPAEFVAWCRARGLNVDANARQAFANERALQAAKDLG